MRQRKLQQPRHDEESGRKQLPIRAYVTGSSPIWGYFCFRPIISTSPDRGDQCATTNLQYTRGDHERLVSWLAPASARRFYDRLAPPAVQHPPPRLWRGLWRLLAPGLLCRRVLGGPAQVIEPRAYRDSSTRSRGHTTRHLDASQPVTHRGPGQRHA